MSKMTGGQALAKQLALEGLQDIFLVPGVQLDWAVDGIREMGDAFRLLIPRHEQTTSYMADGYARASGKIGVCMTVPGPGLTNAMAGLSTAYACSSPLLSITGQIHSTTIGAGYGMLHEIKGQSELIGSVTKWHGMATTPSQVPALVREAVSKIRSGRPQPVGIEIPHDVLSTAAEVELVQPPLNTDGRLAPDASQIEAAAAVLAAAKFPVIHAGGGVLAADASAALEELASRLQAPVIMAETSRGAISDRHPMAVTSVAGRAVIRHADVVLVVGSRFMNRMAPVPQWASPDTQFIYLNVEAEAAAPPRKPGLLVQADACLGLEALTRALPASNTSRVHVVEAARQWAAQQIREVEPQFSYVQALRRAIPDDGFLINELTQVGYLSTVAYPVHQPRTLVTPGYQGTLGFGFPTALGVAAAMPDRAVVCITGDGGFGWGMQELATARRYGLNMVVIVFNDGHFGNVRLLQQQTFGHTVGVELCNPDFPKLADAFGIPSATVSSSAEMETALRGALSRGGPSLLEVRVGPMPSAWHLIGYNSVFKRPSPEPADPIANLLKN
ncbi:thiamine pyrophosphate-dependent enzyme [Ottowia thiooxydans]|uniref:thiamine pyrophosphate-dependent enzyme n=1 Tax=Ottowia thiooxydans TaxID=219182 RepID=UPI0003FFAD56|nr:thiamine pyrophosphate-dependent enzyme [Ottowia thiooxydans]